MNIWFTSDLHLGHNGIEGFRKHVRDSLDNTCMIQEDWFKNVKRRDIVWVLGDIAFTDDGYNVFKGLPGEKRLILGNHDKYPIARYARDFKHVYGLKRYHKAWLSHCPIHPEELRGKGNIHGHVHYNTLPDDRYFNCSVENLLELVGRSLITLDELRQFNVTI